MQRDIFEHGFSRFGNAENWETPSPGEMINLPPYKIRQEPFSTEFDIMETHSQGLASSAACLGSPRPPTEVQVCRLRRPPLVSRAWVMKSLVTSTLHRLCDLQPDVPSLTPLSFCLSCSF